MSKNFTPTDEKVLAGYAAWISLVRALQQQGSLDLTLLDGQLTQAHRRYLDLGETGAAGHLLSHLDDVRRMMQIAPKKP